MWNNIPKPNSQAYTNLNAAGKEQYDQSDVQYDSATTFYDGVDTSQWTDVSKPNNTWTKINKPT